MELLIYYNIKNVKRCRDGMPKSMKTGHIWNYLYMVQARTVYVQYVVCAW